MLDSMVRVADIEDMISAHEIGWFKLSPDLCRYTAARAGTPVDRIAHVTTDVGDVTAARYVGMQSVWVDRRAGPWERFYGEPDLVVEDFHSIADAVGV